jgi:hypothetical protein
MKPITLCDGLQPTLNGNQGQPRALAAIKLALKKHTTMDQPTAVMFRFEIAKATYSCRSVPRLIFLIEPGCK